MLDRIYAWLDARLREREWAAGRRIHAGGLRGGTVALLRGLGAPDSGRLPARCARYRARLLARPSFARAVDEARPFRGCFPPGAPDRD